MTISGLVASHTASLLFPPIFSPHLSPAISLWSPERHLRTKTLIIHCKTCFSHGILLLLCYLKYVIPFILSFRLKTFHPGLFSPSTPHLICQHILMVLSDSDPIITSTATALVHAITNLWFTAIAAFQLVCLSLLPSILHTGTKI